MTSLLERIRQAGAPTENATTRDGFLSYAGETHAVGYGLGLGLAAALRLGGIPWIFELFLMALGGVAGKRRLGNERVWREITDEPQYFLGAFVAGFVVGGVVLVAAGVLVL